MHCHVSEVGDGSVHGCWLLHVQLCPGWRTSLRARQKSHPEVRAAPGMLSELSCQLRERSKFLLRVHPEMPSLRYFQRPRMNLPWFCLARTRPKTLWIRMDSTSTSQCTVNSGSQILSFWRRSRIRFSLKVSRLIVSFILCVCLFCHCLISLTITITIDSCTSLHNLFIHGWCLLVSWLLSNRDGCSCCLYGPTSVRNKVRDNNSVLSIVVYVNFNDSENCLFFIMTLFFCGVSLLRGKKIDRLNIVLLTDLSTEASSDQQDVIIENLKQAGITLQCLYGPVTFMTSTFSCTFWTNTGLASCVSG